MSSHHVLPGISELWILENPADVAAIEKAVGISFESSANCIVITNEKSIKIEHIRDLQTQLASGPVGQGSRVVVIYPAEKITPPAQQALLKLLEEPPAQTRIIVTAASTSSVLPTVLSRCFVRRAGESKTISGEHAILTTYEQLQECRNWRDVVLVVQSLPTTKEECLAHWKQELKHEFPLDIRAVRYQERILEALESLTNNTNPALCNEHVCFGSDPLDEGSDPSSRGSDLSA